MERLTKITLAAAVAALAVSPAWAQEQRGGSLGGSRVLDLLGQKSVQEELKMSDDQVKKVTELREKQRESLRGLRGMSLEERLKKIQELSKVRDKAVAEILKPEQLKRIKQISLQRLQSGLDLFVILNNEEIAKSLKISDDQKGKIREIRSKAREESQGLGLDEEGRKKRQDLRKATNEKFMAVLTAEQKAKLKEILGEPFKGKIEPLRPGAGKGISERAA